MNSAAPIPAAAIIGYAMYFFVLESLFSFSIMIELEKSIWPISVDKKVRMVNKFLIVLFLT